MKKLKYNSLILTISILVQLYYINSYRCGTDDLKSIEKIQVNFGDDKRRLDDEWEPIRIHIDYTALESKRNSYSNQVDIIKKALDSAKADYEKILKVKRLKKKYIIENATPAQVAKTCGYVSSVDPRLTGEGLDADMVIFPAINTSLSSSTIAASKSCITENGSRPFGGFILINPSYISQSSDPEKFIKGTLFHELAHIFVFDPELFQQFAPIGTKTVNGKSYYTINSENVKRKAREHFGCGSLSGIELENQGAEGSVNSHWEARVMLGDYLISTNYGDQVLSDISLALFEDSGWYKVQYYTGGLFRYGKGEGCSFLNDKCITNGDTQFHEEFCLSQGGPRCSSSRLFTGFCYLGNYHNNIDKEYQYFGSSNFGGFKPADYCPVAFDSTDAYNRFTTSCIDGKKSYGNVPELGETISKNSICVLSTLRDNDYLDKLSSYDTIRAICHTMECDNTNKKTIFTIGSKTVTCPENGGLIENPAGFTGKFECPIYNMVCTSGTRCSDISSCINSESTPLASSYGIDNHAINQQMQRFPEDKTYNIDTSGSSTGGGAGGGISRRGAGKFDLLKRYYLSVILAFLMIIVN